MIFEVLTGKRYKRTRPDIRAHELLADVLDWLDDMIAKAQAEDPRERFEDAGGYWLLVQL